MRSEGLLGRAAPTCIREVTVVGMPHVATSVQRPRCIRCIVNGCERLKGAFCLQRAVERAYRLNTLGRPPTPPNPRSPRDLGTPLSGRTHLPGRGFSLARWALSVGQGPPQPMHLHSPLPRQQREFCCATRCRMLGRPERIFSRAPTCRRAHGVCLPEFPPDFDDGPSAVPLAR